MTGLGLGDDGNDDDDDGDDDGREHGGDIASRSLSRRP
jgi:hypothetical protein